MVASSYCREFRLNVQPFDRFRFRDTNRRRGAAIQAALDRYNHRRSKWIFLISRCIASLASKWKKTELLPRPCKKLVEKMASPELKAKGKRE